MTYHILNASNEFSDKYPELKIERGWFNNGPQSLINDLPSDWLKNTQSLYAGTNLKLKTLGRFDLIKTKLFAFL